MSKIAFLFPGQGSQYAGMGRELFEKHPVVRETFEQADRALGFSISRLCFEGPEEYLTLTTNTQPAILTVSVAFSRLLQSIGIEPDFVAGHSLGEYSALVAGGAISLDDAVRTVRKRGAYMQEAVPVGAGAMAAILGSTEETVRECCAEAAQGEVCAPANLNSPSQIVIAGNRGAVERAVDLLKVRGARRAVLLQVSAPFHCELMRPAEVRLTDDLNAITFTDSRIPILSNVDARVRTDKDEIRRALALQVSSPVRWEASVRELVRFGVETFVEVGPGKVLSGLSRSIVREVRSLRVEDEASFNETRLALGRVDRTRSSPLAAIE